MYKTLWNIIIYSPISRPSMKEPEKNFSFSFRRFDFWRSIIAECLGTYFLLFLSSAASAQESILEKVKTIILFSTSVPLDI